MFLKFCSLPFKASLLSRRLDSNSQLTLVLIPLSFCHRYEA